MASKNILSQPQVGEMTHTNPPPSYESDKKDNKGGMGASNDSANEASIARAGGKKRRQGLMQYS